MTHKEYCGFIANKELAYVTVKDPRAVEMTQEQVEGGIRVTFDYSKYLPEAPKEGE